MKGALKLNRQYFLCLRISRIVISVFPSSLFRCPLSPSKLWFALCYNSAIFVPLAHFHLPSV